MQPILFVGSSRETLDRGHVASLVAELRKSIDVRPWSEDVFRAGDVTLDALRSALAEVDFAAIYLSADDVATMRKAKVTVARDNAVFELGMAMQVLGRHHAFLLLPSDSFGLHLPSDIQGVTGITFETRDVRSSALAAANIRLRIDELKGPLHGEWVQTWSVLSDKFAPDNQSRAQVAHYGKVIRAEWRTGDRSYSFRGIREGRHVTGYWRDREDSMLYSGTAQFFVAGDAKMMSGKWCGYRDNNQIESGDWLWTRP
ncbi:MAG: nucleotide-binding protein [Acidimicrobiales bacterium]